MSKSGTIIIVDDNKGVLTAVEILLNEKGQIVIPFYTHEGSGLSDTENHLKEACSGATILKGLAIRGTIAQKS